MLRNRATACPVTRSVSRDLPPDPDTAFAPDRAKVHHQTTSTRGRFPLRRQRTDVHRSRDSDHWTQSLPFTCGPAALGSVLTTLGWSPARGRLEEELAIWRESTAVACPGTHPFGLALAAARRGFRADVRTDGPRPWLWHHVRSQHRSLSLRQYREVEESLAADCRRVGVHLEARNISPTAGETGLLLTYVPSRVGHDADPHWIGLVPVQNSVGVMAPLRKHEYRSERSVREWWNASGFEGTRTWVALRPGRTRSSRNHDDGNRTGRSSGSPPTDGHPHHLARRGWSRVEALAWLEPPDRRRTQDPEIVWERAGLRSGETVVEVGAGSGYFALSAARRVGPSGRVYAVDISGELIDLLHERRTNEDLPQLIPVRSTTEAIPIESGVADVLLLANVLHDIPASTLAEAVRLLRAQGRAVNVDWKKEETPGGPPLDLRFSEDKASSLLTEQGLTEVDRWEFGPYHYGLTFRRTTDRRSLSSRSMS